MPPAARRLKPVPDRGPTRAKNGADPGQDVVQLTGPQGNAVVGLPHHVLAQLHRVVPVLGEDAEHVDDCVVDPIAVIRVGDCQCGGDYGQPDPVITLPPGIAELTSVRRFVLYGSNLVRYHPRSGP